MADLSAGVAAAKLGLDASKQGACFICEREVYFVTLDENIGSLKYERGELMKLADHVQSRYQEIQRENPPRMTSHNLCAWVDRVGVLDRDHLGRVIEEAEAEIGSKCRTFFCPNNVLYSSAVGDSVKRKLEYAKELAKEGRQYSDAVDAIPAAVSLNLSTGRTVTVEGLRQTDVDAANSTTAPAQP